MPQTQPGPPTFGSTLRAASVRASAFRGADVRERLLTAGTALVVVLVARFALGLVALIGSAVGFSVTSFPSGFVSTPVGQFLGSFVLYHWPFYVAAFVAFVAFVPLTPRSDLGSTVRHALRAGIAGTVALAVVGIVPGITLSISGGTWVNLVLYLTTVPLAAGLVDTALLVAGAVLARLWLGGGSGDEVWATQVEPVQVGTDPSHVASDPDDERDAAAPPGSETSRLRGSGPTPVARPARPEAVVPDRPVPQPDDWRRFAPPSTPREDDR